MSSTENYFRTASAIDALIADGLPRLMPMMEELFPLCRSLTGTGVRATLDAVGAMIPLAREQMPTGTICFDWEVPREWNIRDAYVKNSKGERILDFNETNLHVVSYSLPVDATMSLAELQPHLHSLPDQPDAIPYRASYYNEAWGFCLTHKQRESLTEDRYEVKIDSTLEPGVLDFGQSTIKGDSSAEIFFSTYICHPSLANDQLSGIILLAHMMKLVAGLPSHRYSYRAVFAPETIGVIAFLSRHAGQLTEHMKAGHVVTCVGDDGPFTYVRSKRADTAADRIAEHAVRHVASTRKRVCNILEFDPVGSDERQYCSPGLNLPVGSLMRSRYSEFAEYHTSLDNLDFVSEVGMQGSLEGYLRIVQSHELNCKPLRTNPFCEPQLGKRGLYSQYVSVNIEDFHIKLLNILSFADGDHDLIEIADRLKVPVWTIIEPLRRLVEADLITLDLDVGTHREELAEIA